MGLPAFGPVPEATITPAQRKAFLALIREKPDMGNVAALRQVGVVGTRGAIHAAMDDDLEADARAARGWNINAVERMLWQVALDTKHPSWERANARVLKAYRAQFRDRQALELTGADGGPVQTEDRSASLADVLEVVKRYVEGEDGDDGDGGDDPDPDVA